MKKPNPQFDPAEQINQAVNALDVALIEATECIRRVGWLKEKLTSEVDQIREERDRLEVYTEKEAAALLRITERQLADSRRRLNLPHCAFGQTIRYTRQHIDHIIAVFETQPDSIVLKLKKKAA